MTKISTRDVQNNVLNLGSISKPQHRVREILDSEIISNITQDHQMKTLINKMIKL